MVSFIIPYFNGEKYIKECLDSIFNQDVSEDNFEVVAVDDCSTSTESLMILSNYQKSHSNITIIHNKVNLRAGGSRNVGVERAKGEYIWFVDQDDCIKESCLSELIKCCEQDDLDVLYFDYKDFSDDFSVNKRHNVVVEDTGVMSGLEFIKTKCDCDFWGRCYDTNIWHALYKRDFLLENGIESPNVSYCEDMVVAQKVIVAAKRFKTLNKCLYNYRTNLNSVFHTEVGNNGRSVFDGSIYAGCEIIKCSRLVDGGYFDLKKIMFDGGISRANAFTKKLLKISREQRRIFYDYTKKNKDVVNHVFPYFSRINRWILRHPNIVIKYSRIVFYHIKVVELFAK